MLRTPRRIETRLDATARYVVQPLYQGFHTVVYSGPDETRCVNRYGELYPGFAYTERCPEYCVFEAIILPVDRWGRTRSWRYWPYKATWLLYIVDVLRYGQQILIEQPFVERIKHARRLANRGRICCLPDDLNTWSAIEQRYHRNADVYDPIVGVVLRDRTSNLRSSSATLAFRFNVRFAFDLLSLSVVETATVADVHRIHLNFEMADRKVVCLAYGHCDDYIYLCKYDRSIHQFVHVGRLQRAAFEHSKLQYRCDRLYVVGCRVMPRGIIYLRVYYDFSRRVMGYDIKWSDGRYKTPMHNELYDKAPK